MYKNRTIIGLRVAAIVIIAIAWAPVAGWLGGSYASKSAVENRAAITDEIRIAPLVEGTPAAAPALHGDLSLCFGDCEKKPRAYDSLPRENRPELKFVTASPPAGGPAEQQIFDPIAVALAVAKAFNLDGGIFSADDRPGFGQGSLLGLVVSSTGGGSFGGGGLAPPTGGTGGAGNIAGVIGGGAATPPAGVPGGGGTPPAPPPQTPLGGGTTPPNGGPLIDLSDPEVEMPDVIETPVPPAMVLFGGALVGLSFKRRKKQPEAALAISSSDRSCAYGRGI